MCFFFNSIETCTRNFFSQVDNVLSYLNNTSQNAQEAEKSFDTPNASSLHNKHRHDEEDDIQDEGFHDNHDLDTNTSTRTNTDLNH